MQAQCILKLPEPSGMQMPLKHKPWDYKRPLKSFVVFITHTEIFLCPITSRPSVLLLGIFSCEIHSTLQSNCFHLNFSFASNKNSDTDETSDVSEVSVFTCKVKLIFFIYFRTGLRERKIFLTLYISQRSIPERFPISRREKHGKKRHSLSHHLPSFPWEWVTGLFGEVEEELSRCDSASWFYGAVCALTVFLTFWKPSSKAGKSCYCPALPVTLGFRRSSCYRSKTWSLINWYTLISMTHSHWFLIWEQGYCLINL